MKPVRIIALVSILLFCGIRHAMAIARGIDPPQQLIAIYNDQYSATLRWENVPGARYYRLQISEQPDFTTVRTDALLLPTRSWVRATVSSLEEGKDYWWRVQAVGDQGGSPWSRPVRLRMTKSWEERKPTALSPPHNVVLAWTNALRLSWSPCNGVTSYRIQISQSPTFDKSVIQVDAADSQVDIVSLPAGRRYWWRVCARRGSESGTWSDVHEFSIAPIGVIPDTNRDDEFSEHQKPTIHWLEKDLSRSTLTIAPNPTADRITIRSEYPFSGLVTLYDILGRRVVEQVTQNASEVNIPVGHLPAGSYTMVILQERQRWIGTVDVLR
ncbi:MAG: T9SS type A sorting domain-containing protein [Candidatus Kapabacteria bacterium]|nr:T9SS type A sorting domain-containing protein [Candidatus Kapabacteria bacterium]